MRITCVYVIKLHIQYKMITDIYIERYACGPYCFLCLFIFLLSMMSIFISYTIFLLSIISLSSLSKKVALSIVSTHNCLLMSQDLKENYDLQPSIQSYTPFAIIPPNLILKKDNQPVNIESQYIFIYLVTKHTHTQPKNILGAKFYLEL